VSDARSRPLDRLKLPPPQVTRRLLTPFGRFPGNAPAFLELDDVVLSDVCLCRRNDEHLTERSDALPVGGFGQVVVAVPARLLSSVGDEFKDALGVRSNLTSRHNDAFAVFLAGHGYIKAPSRPVGFSTSQTLRIGQLSSFLGDDVAFRTLSGRSVVRFRWTLGMAIALTVMLLSGCSPTKESSSVSSSSEVRPKRTGTSANNVGCTTAVATAPTLTHVRTDMTPVQGLPFGVVTTADGAWSFVSSSNTIASTSGSITIASTSGSITVLDNKVFPPTIDRQVALVGTPLGETLSHDGKYLLIADDTGIVVLDTARLESGNDPMVGTLQEFVGGGAIEVAISPDDQYAFVSLENSAKIAVFNLSDALANGFGSQDFIGTIPLGLAPVGMAFSPDGRWLYATSEGQVQAPGTLSVIDVKEAEANPADSVVSTVVAGCSPVRVVVSHDGQTVWVTARGSDALLGFSASSLVSDPSLALVADVLVGPAPVGLSLVNNDSRIVVADSNRFGNAKTANLSVINTDAALAGRSALLGYIPAGLFPREMALHGNELLVTNYSSSQVEALDTTTLP